MDAGPSAFPMNRPIQWVTTAALPSRWAAPRGHQERQCSAGAIRHGAATADHPRGYPPLRSRSVPGNGAQSAEPFYPCLRFVNVL